MADLDLDLGRHPRAKRGWGRPHHGPTQFAARQPARAPRLPVSLFLAVPLRYSGKFSAAAVSWSYAATIAKARFGTVISLLYEHRSR